MMVYEHNEVRGGWKQVQLTWVIRCIETLRVVTVRACRLWFWLLYISQQNVEMHKFSPEYSSQMWRFDLTNKPAKLCSNEGRYLPEGVYQHPSQTWALFWTRVRTSCSRGRCSNQTRCPGTGTWWFWTRPPTTCWTPLCSQPAGLAEHTRRDTEGRGAVNTLKWLPCIQ